MRMAWSAPWSLSQWNYRLAYNEGHWSAHHKVDRHGLLILFCFDEDVVISNFSEGRVKLRALSILYARAVIWLDRVSTLERALGLCNVTR